MTVMLAQGFGHVQHAVIAEEGIRFPRRNGRDNRYLSEPEVASAYRERFTDAQDQAVKTSRSPSGTSRPATADAG